MAPMFKVWDPEVFDECGATDVFALDAEHAAKHWCDDRHSMADGDHTWNLCVRDEVGVLTKWAVTSKMTVSVTFRAERKAA